MDNLYWLVGLLFILIGLGTIISPVVVGVLIYINAIIGLLMIILGNIQLVLAKLREKKGE